ncbi:MAG: hemerythrin domain-containing protein [Ignavibacteriae bacterium]|nr:hemerythrin domain-containing protein [Ignavibacteriota bacterium]MCB9215767.1 hemerythrin domain-containing protein [Ignavibacteria bacterium]
MIDLKELNENDPLKRIVERQNEAEEFSPMDPPDAYSPPAMNPISYDQMPSILQKLMDEHKVAIGEIEAFEGVLNRLRQEGITREVVEEGGTSRFFRFLDEKAVPHNLKEERVLFPQLQQKLLESGEHSQGMDRRTAIDMLEDDHLKMIQLAAVTLNLLSLSVRLPDQASREVTLDVALEQGSMLVELLRLHIFREDNLLFPMAVRLLNEETLSDMKVEFDELSAG